MLQSALDHYRRQQQITALGLVVARRSRWDSLDRLVGVMALFQLAAAEDAVAAVGLMLDEQNLDAPQEAVTVPAALVGSASDGRALRGLLDFTRSQQVTDAQFDRIVSTQLQDVARSAAEIEMAARPKVTGYARVLNTPSCSRCVVLAGKVFRWNTGFQRHPNCDCRHVPSTHSAARDLTFDSDSYFRSLSAAEQDRTFTKAGAELIRSGADIGRVVNARSGMGVTQVAGRSLLTTTAAARGQLRLMPEAILQVATDRADTIRLLKLHRYLAG